MFKSLGIATVFSFILIFNLSQYLSAQENVKFSKLNVDNGLPQSSVTSILQDKKGFMWYGTMSGLNRYDGYGFKTYYFNPRDTNSLSESWITTIKDDESGVLWIGTRNGGLCEFYPQTERFIRHKHNVNNNNSISDNVVNCLLKDGKETLWIGTENGLNKYSTSTNTFEKFYNKQTNEQSLGNNFINCVFKDNVGDIWVGTGNAGLSKLNKTNNTFENYVYKTGSTELKEILGIADYKKDILVIATVNGLRFFNKLTKQFVEVKEISNTLKTQSITSIYKTNENELWCGAQHNISLCSLIKLNIPSGKETVYLPNDLSSDAISNERILTMFKDRSNVMWVGTHGKGLNYFSLDRSKFFHIKKTGVTSTGLLNEYVYSLFEDKDSSVWIGTSDVGISHYYPTKGKMEFEPLLPSLVRINAIAEAENNSLWIGANNRNNIGLVLFDKTSKNIKVFESKPNDEDYINDAHVKTILVDGDLVWIGTVFGGLNVYNTKTKKFKHYTYNEGNPTTISANEINDIYVDKSGILWVATREGVSVFDKKTKNFTRYKYDIKDTQSISNNYVLCITQDGSGNMWMGTSLGLNKFDVKTKKFKSYTINDGLPDNYIYAVLEDKDGFLWTSTNNGLSRFDIKTNTFKNFSTSDGLQSKEFNTHAFHKGKSGNMYFGGINGLNLFNPDSVKIRQLVPDIIVTSFKIFGKEMMLDTAITYKKNITLSYGQNFLSFEFASVDFLFPNKNEFACKMEGFDKEWIQLGNHHNISYSNLDPGNYVLKIKGTNNDGVWNNDGASIYITILPPFYKTVWFYILCIASVCFFAYALHKMRLRGLLKTQQVLEAQVKERTMEISLQKDEIETKNKDITDSIYYAKRIQSAMLPPLNFFKKNLVDSFVLYKPKDIISGDFFWAAKSVDGKIYVVTADCTGHGVPGALMSLIGSSKLNEIIIERKISNPAHILNQLRDEIITSLNPEGVETESQDGMDAVICCYDFENMLLEFACANNPLWIIRNNELIEFKPDKMPIGKHYSEKQPFTGHQFKLQSNDLVISLTDGYADQFGGEKGKKFKYKQLQELLLSICNQPLQSQKYMLEKSIDDWRGTLEQVDDILIVGIRI